MPSFAPTLTSLDRLTRLLTPNRFLAPVGIPLAARWATWLLGVGILWAGGGSSRSRELLWALVIGTALALFVGSWLAVRLFGSGWPRDRGAVLVLAAADLALSLGVLWLEGGWSTGFYELAMTSVMLPALVWGWRGAFGASALFSAGFLGVLVGADEPGGRLNTQVATLLNPWIVASVVAVLGDLLRRLEQAMANNAELAASQERWRIAREIHDGVAQHAYVLALGLETATELVRRGDLDGLERGLPPLEKLSRQALLEIRQYVAEGRPLMLGERSLGAALAGLAREFATVSRVAVEVDAPDEELELSSRQQTALYRLAQESLANVFKHAEAARAWLILRADNGRVELEIADDGRGFEPGSATAGFGLEGMRRRVAELGGRFSVGPRLGGGTRVQVSFPREADR